MKLCYCVLSSELYKILKVVNDLHKDCVLSSELYKMNVNDFLFVYCMVPDEKTGELLSRHLLSLKLIACASLLPGGYSFYEWKGKFQKNRELALICKTKQSLYQKMSQELIKKHPYECPGLCAISLTEADPKFLKWIDEQCS